MTENLQPWIDHDLAGQEAEGYRQGKQNCMEGWARDGDGITKTPFSIGTTGAGKKHSMLGSMAPHQL